MQESPVESSPDVKASAAAAQPAPVMSLCWSAADADSKLTGSSAAAELSIDFSKLIISSSRATPRKFEIRVLRDGITRPTRSSARAAGLDLYSPIDTVITQGSRQKIKLGIAVQFEPDTFGKIESRSGMAANGIFVIGGVIDEDYTGELAVILFNGDKSDYLVRSGDRIAQLLVLPITYPACQLITAADRSVGFGSSGR